jgi:hypothetical protein
MKLRSPMKGCCAHVQNKERLNFKLGGEVTHSFCSHRMSTKANDSSKTPDTTVKTPIWQVRLGWMIETLTTNFQVKLFENWTKTVLITDIVQSGIMNVC